MNVLEQLQLLGLDQNEAKIYLALLEIGRGNVAEICRTAGLNRTTGYDILERLGLDGLVSRAKVGKKRLYVAESPTRLKQYLADKKRAAERRMEEAKNILPDLQSLYRTEIKPIVKFAEGRTAIERIYTKQLEAKSTIYSILELKGYSEYYDEIGARTSAERARRGIKQKVLAQKNDIAIAWWKKIYGGKKHLQAATPYRWLEPKKSYSPAAEILIFDDKVIGLLTKPGENAAFEVQSQSFADSLKTVFELAWEKGEMMKMQ